MQVFREYSCIGCEQDASCIGELSSRKAACALLHPSYARSVSVDGKKGTQSKRLDKRGWKQ